MSLGLSDIRGIAVLATFVYNIIIRIKLSFIFVRPNKFLKIV